jgi:maltose O-acetyltransferase
LEGIAFTDSDTMGVVRIIAIVCLNKLAEWEFLINQSMSFRRQIIRILHFRLLRVKHKGTFRVGLGFYAKNGANIYLGERCCLGSFTRIWDYHQITIGDDFLSAGCLTINSGGHDPVTLKAFSEPIHIGCRVWCGVNVTILSGVTIGNDVVIGAGSVVTRDIPDRCVVVGIPARPIRQIDRTNISIESQVDWGYSQ